MIDIKNKSKIHIHWNVSPYDYSKESENSIIAKISEKYNISKDRVKVIPNFTIQGDTDGDIALASDVIQNIQDPLFQVKLFKDYLKLNNIEDYDFDLITKIDSEINAQIDYQVYDKYRKYSVKWIRWDNFLSYGASNSFDFTTISGLTSLSGDNQAGKTTLSIDLIHFLLFGDTNRFKTQDKLFNKHLPEATNVVVEGCICIDGVDYVIKRTLSRPSLDRRTKKSKTTQKVEYYKVVSGNLEELDDYIDNQQEENSVKTNKVIKEAIGNESDFDLIMSVTDATLDDLVNKKETERGRLLSRWIGLLPIERKDELARETFNSEIKPRLISNQFDEETLKQEVSAYELSIKTLNSDNKKYAKEIITLDKELENLEKNKATLLSSKRDIDENVLKIDITTLNRKIENNISEGKKKAEEVKLINDELEKVGNVEFSVEEYDNIQSELSKVSNEIAVIGEKYKNIKHNITHLKSSEICPTCHRKLDNVDNSKRIEELTKELNAVIEDGKKKREIQKKLNDSIEKLKANRDLYNKKSQLTVKKSALEVNVERLRNEYKENASLKKEYERNSEAISKNNDIDIQIRNTDVFIRDKRMTRETNSSYIARNETEIKNQKEQISNRLKLIDKIKEEKILLKNWKIYLELVGKNGISKMVLRKTLPIINAKLSQLLGDVCDFDVEVAINDRNDVMFYLIKDGVYSDLSSGSGFELTASGIALRSVLAEMSTMSKMNGLTFDEVWGRVSKDNYDNMRNLLEKVAKDFDWVFLISHNQEIYDMCNNHIKVVKENNISKLVLG